MARKNVKTDRYALACPEGHRKSLQLRVIVDAPPILGAGGTLEPALRSVHCEVQEPGGTIGVDGGVWCWKCEDWYDESECVWPADDAGNPIIDDLGNAGGDDDAR